MDLLFEKDLKENQVGDFLVTDSKKQSILLRLSTPYGANVFHPEYGNKIFDILSENVNDDWINKATVYETECIEQDATLKVTEIKASISIEERKVYFIITYIDLEANDTDQLIWGENIG